MSRAAFTLVELLVVIGIIAVLIAILIPVVGRARQHAVTAQCASNLHQIAVGWRMYAEAHRGIAVPARVPLIPGSRNLYDLGRGPQFRPRWYEFVAAQMKTYAFSRPVAVDNDDRQIEHEALLCPAVPEWRNCRNYVYGYNFQFLGNARQKEPPSKGYISFPVNIAKIRAAETVLVADSMGTAAGKAAKSRRGYLSDGSHDLYALVDHGYTIDPPRLTSSSDYTSHTNRFPADRSAPDPRHGKKANIAYCDGHVELQSLEEIGYIVNPDGSVGAIHPRARNNRFSGSAQDDDPPPCL